MLPPSFLLALALSGPASGDAAAQARQDYERGRNAYEMSDYMAAVEAFQAAFTRADDIEDEELREQVRVTLLLNLGQAQLQAYKVDHHAPRLRQAKDLLEKFLGTEPEGDTAKRAESALGQVEELLTELSGPGEEAADPGDAAPEPEEASSEPEPEPEPASGNSPGRPLMLGGAAALVVGAGGVGLAVAGVMTVGGAESDFLGSQNDADRTAADQRGATGNLLMGVGAAIGGVGIAAGATLVVLGLRKNKAQSSEKLSLVPSAHWSPQGMGLGLGGRF